MNQSRCVAIHTILCYSTVKERFVSVSSLYFYTFKYYTMLLLFLTLQANIQSIMASEKQVNILMKLLDEALQEVDQIEFKLSSYEEMLQSVKEQMDQISESNHLIHLSNTNNVKLLSEIEFLVVSVVINYQQQKINK